MASKNFAPTATCSLANTTSSSFRVAESVASELTTYTMSGRSARMVDAVSGALSSPVAAAAGATEVSDFQSMRRRSILAAERPHQPACAGATIAAMAARAGRHARA